MKKTFAIGMALALALVGIAGKGEAGYHNGFYHNNRVTIVTSGVTYNTVPGFAVVQVPAPTYTVPAPAAQLPGPVAAPAPNYTVAPSYSVAPATFTIVQTPSYGYSGGYAGGYAGVDFTAFRRDVFVRDRFGRIVRDRFGRGFRRR